MCDSFFFHKDKLILKIPNDIGHSSSSKQRVNSPRQLFNLVMVRHQLQVIKLNFLTLFSLQYSYLSQLLFCLPLKIFITLHESKCLLSLNVNKACGPDGLTARMLREAAPCITLSSPKLFNTYLKLGKSPSKCKSANITPVSEKVKRSLYLIIDQFPEHALWSKFWKN